ncbi:MAG TPA: right-handed parallel beta-helix repeat-containing protein, partial [Balneolales bacterium]|nr:right-handed parallel beta-helix repeat-containing protein [Balneolales bacterium]
MKFNPSGTWQQSDNSTLLSLKGGVTYDGCSWKNDSCLPEQMSQKATFKMLGDYTANKDRPGLVIFRDDNPTIETVLKGFEIDGNKKLISGITVNWPGSTKSLNGQIKRIEGCYIHDFGSPPTTPFGIYSLKVGANKDYTTENIEIIDNRVEDAPRACISIYDAVSDGAHEIKNVLIRGNRVTRGGNNAVVRGNGIHFKNKVTGAIVEYNLSYNNDGSGILLEDSSPRPGPKGIILRRNILYGNNVGGITLGRPGSKSVEIEGNWIYKNAQGGVLLQSDLKGILNVKIYKNTLVEDVGGEIIVSSAARFETFEITKNVLNALSTKIPLVNSSPDGVKYHSDNEFYRPGGGILVKDRTSSYQLSNLDSWDPLAGAENVLKNPLNPPTGFIGLTTENTDGFDTVKGDVGASKYGVITLTKTLSGLKIDGPLSLKGGSSGTYTATANWSDGTTSPVTPLWNENSSYASITSGGVMTTLPVSADQTVTVSASYTSGGITKPAFILVSIATSPEPPPAEVPPDAVQTTLGPVTAPMQMVSAPDAPGGSYIETTTSNSGSAVYSINIAQPGTYKIIAEVFAADASSDSFLVKIDNGPADIWDLNPKGDPALYNIWRQDEVTARGTGTFDTPEFDPLTVELGAGAHTITISGRESNSRLAYLYFMIESSAIPSPLPVLVFRAESGQLTADTMKIVSSLDIPGGSYITPTTRDSGSAVYDFNIDYPGTYKIVAEVYSADIGSDSFLVKIDDLPEDIWDLNPKGDPALYNIWRQDEVTARGTGTFDAPQFDPLKVRLAAGAHTITISGRELDSRLAYFYLIMVPGVTELIEAESGALTGPMQVVASAEASGGAYIASSTKNS